MCPASWSLRRSGEEASLGAPPAGTALSDYYKLEYGVTNPDTAAAVGIVEAWHEALNSGDTERLVTLSHPHVEVGGPHGTGHGTKLLQEWADRANIRLTPLRVFHLEAEFHRQGRYLRFCGNHDDEWRTERDGCHKHLQPLFGGKPLKVLKGLKIPVVEGSQEVGKRVLVDGHQGTAESDRWSGYSRLVVRYLWRPFQRATSYSLHTPATKWDLRENHNIAMYTWAANQTKLVLIAGHTHRPVFESQSLPAHIKERLDAIETQLAATPNDDKLLQQAGDIAAELEWVRAQENQKPGSEGDAEGTITMTKPCYFNTGCCSFLDGDITGIEIDKGEIRLVRWPDDQEQPRPQILEKALLKRVLARC